MKLRPSRVAAVAVGVIVGMLAAAAFFAQDRSDVIATAVIGGWLLITAGVGALIAVRRSGHAVGWLLIAIAMVATAGMLVQSYAVVALGGGTSLPGGIVAGWLSLWLAIPALALFVFLLLVFPTGGLPSPRWRIVGWATIAGVAGGVIGTAFMPDPLPAIPTTDNPLGIPGAGPVLEALASISTAVVALCALAAIASQVVRARRARDDQAQQIKWVAYAMVMVPVLLFVSQLVLPQGASDEQWLEFALNMVAATMIPLAIGIAILRYRLYDIDVVINRTLVYGALTAILAGAYLGLVTLFQLAFAPLAPDSDLAVVISTLAVAALFRPARSRIQAFIDRRFYRSRYDAAKTLEAFSTRLRDEVELAAVRDDLLGVVQDALRPAHASLWLRHHTLLASPVEK